MQEKALAIHGFATGCDNSPLGLGAFDESYSSITLAFRYHRAHIRAELGPIDTGAHGQRVREICDSGNHLVMNIAVHNQPRHRGADLARVKENAPPDAIEQVLNVRVVVNDGR